MTQLFNKAKQNLQKYWGYDSFREGQQEAIRSVLEGKPTLVLFPTGGGKSLCYQVPATVFEGMTLVISPLIALMQDQVQQLNVQNISATFINSTLPYREVEQRLVNARNGMYKLLYCSPERLDTQLWKTELSSMNISLVAVDEAHCISEWGHDFRPDYRKINPALKSIAASAGWIALTATATPEVRADIVENLQFEDPVVVSTGFERPNLKWWVVNSPKKKKKLLKCVHQAMKIGSGSEAGPSDSLRKLRSRDSKKPENNNKGGGIIYGGTRRNCEELAKLISTKLNIKAAAYHAGMDNTKRAAIQEAWITDKVPVVVATSAFGMGIDKADCRFVIHYQMPYSLEAYYQQAGRAGRDGKESFPILLFKPSDAQEAAQRIKDSYPEKKQLQKVYDVLCDTLHLAVGSQQDKTEAISINSLKKRADLGYGIVHSSLKVLKKLNIIELEDRFTPRAGIKFEVNVKYLQNRIKEEKNKEKAIFLDLLYRRLGQEAFADYSYLKLKTLQQKLNITKNGVLKGLQVLQDHDHLLTFEVLGERPLVRLMDERVRKLQISRKKLDEDRHRLMKKLDYMKGYVDTDLCREMYIQRYFGKNISDSCGHCDNCLKNTNEVKFSKEEVCRVKTVLGGERKSIKNMRRQLQWTGKKLKHVVSYLIREEKIAVEEDEYIWKE